MKQVLFIKKGSGDLTNVWYQIVRHGISVVHMCAYELPVVLSIGCSDYSFGTTPMVLRGVVGVVMK